MNVRFTLPDIGEGTAEAEIAKWHVDAGDVVKEDQLLVDMMTDKATVEMTSPVTGRIVTIHGAVGDKVPVGALLVEFLVEGEEGAQEGDSDWSDTPSGHAVPDRDHVKGNNQWQRLTPTYTPETDSPTKISGDTLQTAILASPAARKLAYERGLDLRFISGTGPGGRILLEDVESQAARDEQREITRTGDTISEQKIVGLRRQIAEKMQTSKRQIPHFGYVEEFDLTELENLRSALNAKRAEGQPKLTLLPFFIRSVTALVPRFPHLNARYDEITGVLTLHGGVHVGIAAQTPRGLMVPVIRHAEQLDLWECASELARVTGAARDGSAKREELSGSTITLTSLGSLGGIAATPIINHPEVAIIGPNKLVERPVVAGGAIVIRKMMNVSSSFDHRIVDGHDAARFIQEMKQLIERPSLMFIERRT